MRQLSCMQLIFHPGSSRLPSCAHHRPALGVPAVFSRLGGPSCLALHGDLLLVVASCFYLGFAPGVDD